MIYKCSCGVLWTSRSTSTRVDPSKASPKTCPDCTGFEWTKYNERVAYAKSLKLSR